MIARRTMTQVLGNFAVSFFLGLLVTTPASVAEDRIVGSKQAMTMATLGNTEPTSPSRELGRLSPANRCMLSAN